MRLQSDHDLKLALDALCAQCPLMAKIFDDLGAPPLRRRSDGFEGLAEIIIFQQISIHAGRSILAKTLAALGGLTPQNVLAADDDTMRRGGLSRPKIKTLRAIAEAAHHGTLDLEAIRSQSAEQITAHLTRVKGIGPWTADIYALFCLGHFDIWPNGDLAVQEAVKEILNLATRPTAEEMPAFGTRWAPYRAVAARLLWHYYGARKGGQMEPLALTSAVRPV